MEYDTLFRIIMIIGLLLVLPFAAYFRYKAHSANEKIDRMQEGMFIFLGIRVFAGLAFVSLLAYFINPEWMRFASLELPLWLRTVGVLLGALGGILWIYTFKHLGKNLTDTVHVRTNATLVTDGPYKYVRHPFYVAFALLIFANALAAANWFIFLTGFTAFFFIYLRVATEEKKLIERFGDSYRSYMQKTDRFIPKF